MSILDDSIAANRKKLDTLGMSDAQVASEFGKQTLASIDAMAAPQRAQNITDRVQRVYEEPDRTAGLINEIGALDDPSIGGLGAKPLSEQYAEWVKEYRDAVGKGDSARVAQLKQYRKDSLMSDRDLEAMREGMKGSRVKTVGGGGGGDDTYKFHMKEATDKDVAQQVGAMKTAGFSYKGIEKNIGDLYTSVMTGVPQTGDDALKARRSLANTISTLSTIKTDRGKLMQEFRSAAANAVRPGFDPANPKNSATDMALYAHKLEKMSSDPEELVTNLSMKAIESLASAGVRLDPGVHQSVKDNISLIVRNGFAEDKNFKGQLKQAYNDTMHSYSAGFSKKWFSQSANMQETLKNFMFPNGKLDPDLSPTSTSETSFAKKEQLVKLGAALGVEVNPNKIDGNTIRALTEKSGFNSIPDQVWRGVAAAAQKAIPKEIDISEPNVSRHPVKYSLRGGKVFRAIAGRNGYKYEEVPMSSVSKEVLAKLNE